MMGMVSWACGTVDKLHNGTFELLLRQPLRHHGWREVQSASCCQGVQGFDEVAAQSVQLHLCSQSKVERCHSFGPFPH